jgi:succinoglycan biosynthesis transport protein ExoP
MPDEKPVHIPRRNYPDLTYPEMPSLPRRGLDEGEGDSIHLLDYWHVSMARKWTILAIFATVTIITGIATFKQVPIFRASATLQIDRESSNVLGDLKDVYQVQVGTDDTLQTQYKVLESRSLARHVVQDLDLDKDAEFLPPEPNALSPYVSWFKGLFATSGAPGDEPDALRPVIDAYLERIDIAPVRQARLVTISFESKDPTLAAKIINAHARRYITQNFEFKFAATQDATDFLTEKVSKLKSDLEKAEDKVQQYSRETNILITDEGQNAATEKLKQLQTEYTKAQMDLFQKQSYFELVAEDDVDALPQVASNQRITELTGRLIDLQKQDQELGQKYGEEWQDRKTIKGQMRQLEATLAAEKGKVVRTIKSEYTASTATEGRLAAALAAQRQLVENTNQDFVQYNIYKGEADSTKALYDSLLRRLNEAQVSASLKASNIRIVDPAEVPQRPIRPRKTVNLLFGALLGIGFGVGFAFFQEYLDNSLKSPEDVTRYLHAPTLGTIPNLQSLSDGQTYGYGYGYGTKVKDVLTKERLPLEFVTHGAPTSLMAEAYRSMRTSLLLSSADQQPRVVLVTSALPSEGKTVTAINTAISLTQTGSRVVLIDADMRKPRVHSVFALGNVPGLSSFLTGAATLKEVIHEVSIPNLFILPCGIIPPNPGELILSNKFTQLLSVLREYFDYVVIDSPPVVNVSDARVLASYADAATLVVKAFSTSRHLAQRAVEYLRQSRIRNLGVILNDLDVHARTGYYSYYSGRNYYPSNYQTPPPGDAA